MIRINYKAEALQPIHTGSDEDYGTMRTLRREKRRLKNPVKVTSGFSSDSDRREALVAVLLSVYKSISKELKSKSYGFYEAYAGKVLAATRVRTKYEFLTELCKMCNVRLVSDSELIKNIDLFHDDEFLHTIRQDHQYLMLLMRHKIQNNEPSVFISNAPGLIFTKNFEWIPLISGNTIRGVMRRVMMKDFCDQIGVNELNPIPKDTYHQLFTGGNITGSTAFEDIEKREQYINFCPAIGLFGSAIGNMTIQGAMKVGGLRPVCREHGNGEISFWETLGREFATRSDSSKKEREVSILAEDNERAPDQMKYEFEVFNTGTIFDSDLICTSTDEVVISAFWRMIEVYKEFGFVAGMSGKGMGAIDVQIDVPDGASDLYLSHLQSVKDEALAFFTQKELV